MKKEKFKLNSADGDKTGATIEPVGFSPLPVNVVTEVAVIPAREMDIGSFEKKLAVISDGEARLRFEMEWLMVMRRRFEGGLKIISTRDGFILYWIRAIAPCGKFGLWVEKYFAGLPERTRSYCMWLCREFLKTQNIALNEAGTTEYFLELRDTWLLSKIILAATARQVNGSPAKKALVGTIAVENEELKPNKRSAFVLLESHCVRLMRIDKTIKSALYACKRLNPADREEAAKFINLKLSAHLRPVFLDAVYGETVEDPATLI